MKRWLAAWCRPDSLVEENRLFRGTGGVSRENGRHGFRPAFHDTETGRIYLSRFTDGRPAPVHLYEGLPAHLVAARGANQRATALKAGVVAGFVRDQRFYTRGEAAREQATPPGACADRGQCHRT